jgi:hypothetical protein
MREMPKTGFNNDALGRKKETFEWHSHFILQGNWLNIVSIQVIPPQTAKMQMLRHFAKSSPKTNTPIWSLVTACLTRRQCCALDDQAVIHQFLAGEKFPLIFKASRHAREVSPASYLVRAKGAVAGPQSKPLITV